MVGRYTGHGRDGIRDPYGLVEDKEKNVIITDHTDNRIHLNIDGQLQHYLLQADERAVKLQAPVLGPRDRAS